MLTEEQVKERIRTWEQQIAQHKANTDMRTSHWKMSDHTCETARNHIAELYICSRSFGRRYGFIFPLHKLQM